VSALVATASVADRRTIRDTRINAQDNDPMYVVRHHHERIDIGTGKGLGQLIPPPHDHVARRARSRNAVNHVP
jgi:hypothetical protein